MFIDILASLVVRGGIALLFAVSAWHKARNIPETGAVIAAYRIVPEELAGVTAIGLIGVEAVIAVTSLFSPLGLHAAAALLFVYAAVIGLNIARGNDRIDCGCLGFGAVVPRLKWAMVARNFVIACLTEFVASAAVGQRALAWVDILSLASAIAILSLLYVAHEAVIALAGRSTVP